MASWDEISPRELAVMLKSGARHQIQGRDLDMSRIKEDGRHAGFTLRIGGQVFVIQVEELDF